MLVTAFHDWRDCNEPPTTNLFRCRDNPSCRLLLGPPSSAPPITRDSGELVKELLKQRVGRRRQARGEEIEWTFQTLPTVWGTASGLDLHSFDAVIHLGLGVYDNRDTIILEDGAYNIRCGRDAVGLETGSSIDYGAGARLENSRMSAVVRELDGEKAASFTLRTLPARPQNSYICNETHWRALKALEVASENENCRLRAVFFVHIPIPKKSKFLSGKSKKAFDELFADLEGEGTDYGPLACGVAETIARLLSQSGVVLDSSEDSDGC